MAVCGSCGNRVSELALECARCRAPVGPAAAATPAATPPPPAAATLPPPPPPPALVTPVAVLAPPMPPPPPPPQRDRAREAVSRTVLVIAAVAALIVVAMIAVALITQDPEGGAIDDAGAAPAAEVAAQAEVEVPGTAPDGKDSAGNDVGYGAAHLVDGDPSTAWRVEGDAEGEEIVLTLPEARTITEVGIVNGYAKVDDDSGDRRYGQNRRVLAATWIFDDGTEVSHELEETVEAQRFTLDTPVETTTVRIRLDEVSDAGGRDFTAIGELSLLGR